MGEQRIVTTNCGEIHYILERKSVKNINLRVQMDGAVTVSANRRVAVSRIDQFIREKAEQIVAYQEKASKRSPVQAFSPADEAACRAMLMEVVMEIYPLFASYGIPMPTVKFRDMKTRWGSCSYYKGNITLNKQLFYKPKQAVEYVVLHEFCHFIHHDHSANFYNLVAQLMPDWKQRKALL